VGFGNVGRVWTPALLRDYAASLTPHARWQGVTLHHTGSPNLTQRPDGFKIQHMINLRDYYRDKQGWSSAPHFFTDEDQVFGLCPLNEVGVHAPGFNANFLGIEALGDYNVDDPKSGRGLAVWRTTAQSAAILLDWLKLPCNGDTIKIHREDQFSNTACPGDRVKKPWLLALINEYLAEGLADANPERWTVLLSRKNNKRWTQVQIHANAIFVPVFAFLKENGVPSAQILANLKRNGKNFAYGNDPLDHAFSGEAGTTWAPLREVAAVLKLPVTTKPGRIINVG